MRRRTFVLALLVVGALTFVLVPAAGAQTGSITFDPSSTVMAGGGKLFINTKCEANAPSFLYSNAFAGQPGATEFAGVPAFAFTTSATGTFGIGITIEPSVPGGAYNVGLRCGGGAAGSATLTVLPFNGPLPRTGTNDAGFALVGAIVLAVGGALLLAGRRRVAVHQ